MSAIDEWSGQVRDHYHSHRLSVWLSLIPRLHQPIELKDSGSVVEPPGSFTSNDGDEDDDGEEDGQHKFESDQYFYLRHHLLPDHENPYSYDGVVKQLTLRIPQSKQWQRAHLRQNMTSFYEQHQQMLYGRLFDLPNSFVASSSGGSGVGVNENRRPTGQPARSQEQYARRQIDESATKRGHSVPSIKHRPEHQSNTSTVPSTSVLHYVSYSWIIIIRAFTCKMYSVHNMYSV